MQKKNKNEIWKDINGFPGYQVSNLGNVKNIKRDSLIAAHPNKKGYYHVGLYRNGERQNLYVHTLVGNAFLGCPSDPTLEIDHVDTDKSNNNVTNLEWVTRSENTKRAFAKGVKKPVDHPNAMPIKIVETGEIFESARKCAKDINGDKKSVILCAKGKQDTHKDLHFKFVDKQKEKKPFLYDYQMDAVNNLKNGAILNGGVGSGKSRTALFYYFKEQGGWIDENGYKPMKKRPKPKDLYIITTARKRDTLEWEGELVPFLLSVDPEKNDVYHNKIVVDSWNNIQKYKNVYGAFFIFDEQRVVGSGAWVKAFLNIARKNEWILLSATPGDCWSDYIPVFVANGFYRNKTEFTREHIVYSRFSKFPKIDRYINTGRLIRLRNDILIDMDFKRKTIAHHEDVYVKYDIVKYKDATRTRWDPYRNEPIQQASGLCYVLRRIVNESEYRVVALLELLEKTSKAIIFYNFDYELDILLNLHLGEDVEVAQWNGHKHQPVPDSKKWIYLVQYTAGAEGWNCIKTDTIIFFSQNYSYKIMAQACGRIDRLNTPFTDLYYYHLKSRSGIDLAISKALNEKKTFNETKWAKW